MAGVIASLHPHVHRRYSHLKGASLAHATLQKQQYKRQVTQLLQLPKTIAKTGSAAPYTSLTLPVLQPKISSAQQSTFDHDQL